MKNATNNFEEIEKNKTRKLYITTHARYVKNVVDGDVEPVEYFKSIIIPISDNGFLRSKKFVLMVIDEAVEDGYLTTADKEFLYDLASRKSKKQLELATINMNKYYELFISRYEQIAIDPDIDNCFAFIVAPIVYSSFLYDCVMLKYKDIEILDVMDTVVIVYSYSKGVKKTAIDAKLSQPYKIIFNALKNKYGEDEYIFPNTKETTWDISKTGIKLFRNLESYIKNNEQEVKDSNFLTVFKRTLKDSKVYTSL